MRFVQINQRSGTIRRVPHGPTPVIELSLESHQRIISVEAHVDRMSESAYYNDRRKTVDWDWTAWIESSWETP